MFIRFLPIFRYFMRLTTVCVSATIKALNTVPVHLRRIIRSVHQKEGTFMPHLLCLGDSITDCGRLFSTDPLGNGYVKMLSSRLHDTGHNFSIENKGIDGFTLERLLSNIDSWLNGSDPDVITVLIGINDVGIMMNTRRSSAQQDALMEKFTIRYELLAKKLSGTESRKRKLFFMEPFVFPWPRYYASWLPLLSQMSGHIQEISQDHGAVFIPLQNDLDRESKHSGISAMTLDGIHLTPQGHQILAEKLYTSITSER